MDGAAERWIWLPDEQIDEMAAPTMNFPMPRLLTEYWRRGWSIIPLTPGRKTPYTQLLAETTGTTGWKAYQNHPAGATEIRAWFTDHCLPENDPQTPNIGLVTGVGGLYVVDVDDLDTPQTLSDAQTTTVQTGRGHHYYFTYFGDPLPSRIIDLDGRRVEFKGAGAYVTAANSKHPSGTFYRVESDLATIKDLPEPILSKVKRSRVVPVPGTIDAGSQSPYPRCIEALLADPMPDGVRDSSLFALYSLLQRNHVFTEKAASIVERKNSSLANPITDSQLRHTIVDYERKYPKFGCRAFSRYRADLAGILCPTCPHHNRSLQGMVKGLHLDSALAELEPSCLTAYIALLQAESQGRHLSNREAASNLTVSRNTVARARRLLEKNGLLAPCSARGHFACSATEHVQSPGHSPESDDELDG